MDGSKREARFACSNIRKTSVGKIIVLFLRRKLAYGEWVVKMRVNNTNIKPKAKKSFSKATERYNVMYILYNYI